jgi:hypothetical protein
MGTSRLSREARINIQQIILTLTMLLSNARHAEEFQAYNCRDIKGAVKAYTLAPHEVLYAGWNSRITSCQSPGKGGHCG